MHDEQNDVLETTQAAPAASGFAVQGFVCPHFTVTAGVPLTGVRCGICTPKKRVVLRVEYFVETDSWNADRLTDNIADGIAEQAEQCGALANGGVRPLSLFELEHHDGMADPEYRAGVAEAEAELRLARAYPLHWWGHALRTAWHSIFHASPAKPDGANAVRGVPNNQTPSSPPSSSALRTGEKR